MLESFSASGSRVHTPCGPRKSGIPDSVEMPAPVKTTTSLACSTHARTASMEFRADAGIAAISSPQLEPLYLPWSGSGTLRQELYPARIFVRGELVLDVLLERRF